MNEEMTGSGMTRRDFLRGTAGGALGAVVGWRLGCGTAKAEAAEFATGPAAARVVLIRDERAIAGNQSPNAQVVAEMLDKAVAELTGKPAAEAWRGWFKAGDTVGVKISQCGWMKHHTSPVVMEAVCSRIKDCGVAADRAIARDGGLPVKDCTALVNVPSIKVHKIAGIAVSIKNYINFSSNPSKYHPDSCAELGEVWTFPDVKGKTRLIVVDALQPYFGDGPQIEPKYRWDYNGLLVATDPVAVDTVCLALAQKKRDLFKGEPWPIQPPPRSISTADKKHKLGVSDPGKIQLVRLGWQQEVLI